MFLIKYLLMVVMIKNQFKVKTAISVEMRKGNAFTKVVK